MKKYEEVNKELRGAYNEFNKLDAKYRTEESSFCDKEFSLKERVAYYAEHKEEREAHLSRLAELNEKKKVAQYSIQILKNNAKLALFNDCAPIILETMQKYKGKSLGTKTEKKIMDELLKEINCWVYIRANHIVIHKIGENGRNECEVTFGAKYIDGNRKCFLENNKIQTIDMEELEVYYIKREFVENIPEFIETFKTYWNLAYGALKTFKEYSDKINHMLPEGITDINYWGIRFDEKLF